jgi:hypothetical protein
MIFVSELDIVVVGQLKFFADVLFPGGVEDDQLGEEMSAHYAFGEVGGMEGLAVVVAFHPAAGAFHVFAIVHQHAVDLPVVIRNAFPVVDHGSPVEHRAKSQQFGHGGEPVGGFPADVTEGILDESEEVLESSSFVALIDGLSAESVFFEFPVVLLAHRPAIVRSGTCR